jgi:hypothetical protein
MNDEVETLCTEPIICLQGLRKDTRSLSKIACVPAESRSEDLPNTIQKLHCLPTFSMTLSVAQYV